MLEQFLRNIKSKGLVDEGSKTLIATSGGVDSVVLCHLFHLSGMPFAMAHCNFKLRGEASDLDEIFVKELAAIFKVDFYSIQFYTAKFAKQNKLSIQVAARELRYNWLEETRHRAGCDLIATAHHLDDSIETAFYNFAKGCGIRGLHGIRERNGFVVRPLLFASKQEVIMFAKAASIAFREDASNETDKYNRNLIRHQVIPVFEKINPQFQRTGAENLNRFQEAESLYDFAINAIKLEIFESNDNGWKIDHTKLRSYPAPSSILYELLKPYGFNNDQIEQVLQSIENQPGSFFHTAQGSLLVDRFFLIFSFGENIGGVIKIHAIPNETTNLPDGSALTITPIQAMPELTNQSPNTAWLDASVLEFPLVIRHWRHGDWFYPLGMGGKRQKLQDFFSNNKLTRFEKEKVWLLESGGNIAWVVGWRLDERFKVTSTTNRIIQAVFL